MGLAYGLKSEQASFACLVEPDGECVDFKKLPNLLNHRKSYRVDERVAKVSRLTPSSFTLVNVTRMLKVACGI